MFCFMKEDFYEYDQSNGSTSIRRENRKTSKSQNSIQTLQNSQRQLFVLYIFDGGFINLPFVLFKYVSSYILKGLDCACISEKRKSSQHIATMGETLDKFLVPAFTLHYIFFCLLFILCEILSKPEGRALLKIITRPLWLLCRRAGLRIVKLCLFYFRFLKTALFVAIPQKKALAQQEIIGNPLSLYRLPVEVRLEIFQEVYSFDNGNTAMRSLLWALREDPVLLEEANEVYYPRKNFRLAKKNDWSLLNFPSTRVQDLELVKHITIDLRYVESL